MHLLKLSLKASTFGTITVDDGPHHEGGLLLKDRLHIGHNVRFDLHNNK